ncbi:hypothetical protein H5410_051108 [Solanum commersonii]|uniref:Uncharacterized protein n=1 Tax=Solanum commersonii TaxID=4109 RepID=A0A9J5WXA5_SOLCO|nr:hypothetical protein H5410_051108 [Solanum commersonii]
MYERLKSRPIVPGRVVNLSQLRLFVYSMQISVCQTIVPDDFEVTLEGAKTAVAEPRAQLSEFGPLSLCFEHRILAHIIATTLLPRKGSLSNISNRDMFVLYCLLKKYQINWANWFKEYMWESAEESNPSASLPYGFSSLEYCMGYVEVGNIWVKKDSVQKQVDAAKPTKISAESAALLLQDSDELKTRIMKVFRLQKDTSTDIGKLRIAMTWIKQEGITTVNKLIRQVDSLKCRVDSSNNELAIFVHNSYSSLSRNVERSYNSFSERVISTLKYFWSSNR